MASRTPAMIRNLAICGHSSCGKTTLVESLLFRGGAIPRKGRVEEGTTVSDHDAQEKLHKHSIDLTWVHLESKGITVNLIDTPGYRDFIGQVYCALSVVEGVVVVVDADEGVRPNTRKVWQLAEAARLPCFVVINRCDRDQAKPDEALAQVQAQLSPRCLPLTVANGVGPSFSQVELTLGSAARSAAATEAGSRLLEAVIESNDALMERYLGGETLADEEIRQQTRAAVAARSVFPVFFTSADKDIGVPELLDALTQYAVPASDPMGRYLHPGHAGSGGGNGDRVPVETDIGAPFCGHVFRVVSDPYVGKLSCLRVLSGTLVHNGSFLNPHTGKPEKVGKLVRLQGKEQEVVESASAGDFVALAKLEGLKTFDTLLADKKLVMDHLPLPAPMYARAIEPKSKADEKKFAENVPKLVDEDVMVRSVRDSRTHEMVVSGVSQLHLQVIWDRLKSRFGVEVVVKEPKTPYLETISARGSDHFRHRKQSGGSGEFAEVWLRVEPVERGKGVEFINSVFGGAISASYVASAEKGIRAALERGVIAGYPVVDLRVDIFDGKDHPVDSKDIAFQKAGREAFKLAVRQAKPVLLEPIVTVEVTFPIERMGEIQGDLNRRRARVVGADSVGDFETLKAHVPLAEISDYASSLGSMTGGQGVYSIEMSHYEIVPASIQSRLVEAAREEMAKED